MLHVSIWLALCGGCERAGYMLLNTLTQQVEVDFYLTFACHYYVDRRNFLKKARMPQEDTPGGRAMDYSRSEEPDSPKAVPRSTLSNRPLLDSYYDSPAPRRSQENGPAIVSPRAGVVVSCDQIPESPGDL